ncbi:ABC transporter G family member 10 [Corchorus olitorius]|uniref:ABC transporter G family member 10 n=1 Tax=Corchorus olitorius TaxID=93759 RepID=A0A1R3JHU0_9ROSI|nr:ABC transporter G family member 10 [Corchorus olitorius]
MLIQNDKMKTLATVAFHAVGNVESPLASSICKSKYPFESFMINEYGGKNGQKDAWRLYVEGLLVQQDVKGSLFLIGKKNCWINNWQSM